MVVAKYTIFKLGDEELAVESSKITSVKDYTGKKQKISQAPKFILGKDDSGKVLVDLNLYLDFPLKKLTSILYTFIQNNEVGFVVNEKLPELDIDSANISPTPDAILAKYKTHFITGIAKVDDRLIIIIEPSLVFSTEDAAKISISASAQAGSQGNIMSGLMGMFSKKTAPKPQVQSPVQPNQIPNQANVQPQSQQQFVSDVSQQVPQDAQQQFQDQSSQNMMQDAQMQAQQMQSQQYDLQSQLQQVQDMQQGIPAQDQQYMQAAAQITPEQMINQNAASAVAYASNGSNSQGVEVVDNIGNSNYQQMTNSQKLNMLKSEINSEPGRVQAVPEENVDKFLEKLKEDPFLKHQDEIKENLKKIKESIVEMDTFFEELLVKEQENVMTFDASEEVLLSSIGVELNQDPKYLSDLIAPQCKVQSSSPSRILTSKKPSAAAKPVLSASKENSLKENVSNKNIPTSVPNQAPQANASEPAHSVQSAQPVQNTDDAKKSEDEQNKKDELGSKKEEEDAKKKEEELKKREDERKKRCPDNQGFGFWDGRTIFSIEQLEEELKSMQDNEFNNHVGNDKNDFANWTRYAIGLPGIADLLQGAKTKQDAINVLGNYFAGN